MYYTQIAIKQTDPTVIAGLNSFDIRRDMISNSKKKRLDGRTFGAGQQPIFVDEHLSKDTMELLNEEKEVREQGRIRYVWCREGKVVFVWEKEGMPKKRITSPQQLLEFQNKKRNVSVRSAETENG